MDFQANKPIVISDTEGPKMPAWARKLLDAYASCGEIKAACAAANVSRQAHYQHLKNTPVYRAAFQQTEEQVGQMLEDLAVQRVRDGRLVLYQGVPVIVDGEALREYDTQLHCVLLKRFKPDQYRDRASLEVSGSIDLVERMKIADERLSKTA